MISAYLNGNELSFVYDSANRLISAGQNSYTYNVENVRVRNLCGESETTYAYNTNGRLSQLLVKTTDGVIMTIECRNNTSLRYFYAKLKIWHQIFFENLLPNQRFGVETVLLSTVSTTYDNYRLAQEK